MSKSHAATPASEYTKAMLEAGARHDFAPPKPAEITQARTLASKLMDHEVASAETVLSILSIQPASTLVCRERGEVTGLAAVLLLKPEAESALATGEFDGLAPFEPFLARAGEAVTLCYYWGVAGATKKASSAVMELFHRFRYDVLADLVTYTLAATPVGRHVAISRLGLRPARHGDDNLLVGAPTARRWAA